MFLVITRNCKQEHQGKITINQKGIVVETTMKVVVNWGKIALIGLYWLFF